MTMFAGESSYEQTPLLGEVDETESETQSQRSSSLPPPPLQKMRKSELLKEKAVVAAAAVSFLFSLLSLVLMGATQPFVMVSSMLGLVVAPTAAMQQQKLTQVVALDQTNDRMESEVELLEAENARLTAQVQEMEKTVSHLQTMEKTLQTLQSVQGKSLTDLEDQMEDSRKILARMGDNYKARLLQNLISIVLALDDDGSGCLSDAGVNKLIVRIGAMKGVKLNQDKLREEITRHGRSVQAIMGVLRHLLTNDVPTEHNIFSFVEEEIDEEAEKEKDQDEKVKVKVKRLIRESLAAPH